MTAMPDFSIEDDLGLSPVAGVAGAVIVDRALVGPDLLAPINDSKQLDEPTRENIFESLTAHPGIAWAVGVADVAEIDRLNILWASMLAMERAVAGLGAAPRCALIDGNRAPKLACRSVCVVKGDAISTSIALASIVAKVSRDRMMRALAAAHPGYDWHTNAGYGTKAHLAAIERLGITPHHRRSFGPIKALLVAAGEIAPDPQETLF